ncbi:hypothetical protein CUMW_130850 [Citrus unshiu]|uniref:Uncharacterized protein n=2 Tax=Citrus unshiu TaxID=55188 RepID=A0A2H5PF72_CITUN|nr:hypothetical protein CUMW_130850 [Citrus unshiu]
MVIKAWPFSIFYLLLFEWLDRRVSFGAIWDGGENRGTFFMTNLRRPVSFVQQLSSMLLRMDGYGNFLEEGEIIRNVFLNF